MMATVLLAVYHLAHALGVTLVWNVVLTDALGAPTLTIIEGWALWMFWQMMNGVGSADFAALRVAETHEHAGSNTLLVAIYTALIMFAYWLFT